MDNKIIKGTLKTLQSKQGNYLDDFIENEKLKLLIDIIIMIWIVADIIVLTAMYFVDLNNFYNAIIIFDTGLCVVLSIQFITKLHSKQNKKQYLREDWRGVIIDIIAMMPMNF